MIIDFHTHVFPDKIAGRTIQYLESISNMKGFTRGSLDELLASMKKANIDISVVLPVVTRPEQFASINRFAVEISKVPGIISFGGLHPDSENWKEEIDEIVSMGLPGIKLHPDYQKTYVDDAATIAITQYAISKGLHVIFHSGVDVGYPNPVHCTPKRAAAMLDSLERKEGYGKVILAHTGANEMWDDVLTYLAGKDVYFDLAFNLGKIPDETLRRIADAHGVDKLLFATDSPWDSQQEDVEYLRGLTCFSDEEKKMIFEKNARELLNL